MLRNYDEIFTIFVPVLASVSLGIILDFFVGGGVLNTDWVVFIFSFVLIYTAGYLFFIRRRDKTYKFSYLYGMISFLILLALLFFGADSPYWRYLFFVAAIPFYIYEPARKLFFKRYGYSEEDYLKSQDTMPSENT